MPRRSILKLASSLALAVSALLVANVHASIEVRLSPNDSLKGAPSPAKPSNQLDADVGVIGVNLLNQLPSNTTAEAGPSAELPARRQFNSAFVSFQAPTPSSVTAGWPLTADFDRNYFVDGVDLGKWANDFGSRVSSDAYPEGFAGGQDFLAWQRQLGQAETAAPAVGSAPEPTTLVVWSLLAGSAACVIYRHRRQPS